MLLSGFPKIEGNGKRVAGLVVECCFLGEER